MSDKIDRAFRDVESAQTSLTRVATDNATTAQAEALALYQRIQDAANAANAGLLAMGVTCEAPAPTELQAGAAPPAPSIQWNRTSAPNARGLNDTVQYTDPGFSPSTVVSFDFPVRVDRDPSPSSAFAPNITSADAPTVEIGTLGTTPEIVAPDAVVLSRAVLPTFDGITLPAMDIALDPATLPSLAGSFNFENEVYAATSIERLLAETNEILDGRQAIPGWVWDQIWADGAEKVQRQLATALRDARYEHASRGWMLPGAVLLARESAARQTGAEAMSALTREQTTKRAEMVREDFFKAVEIQITLENLLEKIHNEYQERALKAAVESNNANIAVFNAAVQAYQITEIAAAEFAVKAKQLEVQGELAKVQVYEADVKAAALALEYDKNQVELYKADWGGEEAKAKAYAAYADGLRALAEQQKAAVEAYGIEINAGKTKVEAWAMEWDAYVKAQEPLKYRIAAAEARNAYFQAQVQAYQAKVQGAVADVQAQTADNQSKVEVFKAEVQQYMADIQGQAASLDALSKAYSANIQGYSSAVQADTARVDSETKTYLASIEAQKAMLGVQVEQAKARQAVLIAEFNALAAVAPVAAQVHAQLAGSALSALNYSLSGQGSASYSESNQYSENVGVDASSDVSPYGPYV